MCDYSLHGIANRPARVGDKLVSTVFSNSFTRGFTEIGCSNVVVCLMPGTELSFEQDVEVAHIFRRILPRFSFGKTGQRVARFRQVNMERPDTHHDALEFPNGRIVLVTQLCSGQKATVLQLPVVAKDDAERQPDTIPEARRSSSYAAAKSVALPD